MGDRCYMSVTCRRQDRERFEAIGFYLEFESSENCSLIEMVDLEANYAHTGNLPKDIPYHGYNGAGGSYGDGKMTCDGKEYAEVETGHDGGFVVEWDYRNKKPTKRSLALIRRFIVVHKRTQAIMAEHAQEEPVGHLFSPHTDVCVRCGKSAEEDAVENTPCQPEQQ